MHLPTFARVGHARFDALADHIPFELRKDRKDVGEGAPCRRREIEGLRQQDESHTSSREIVQRRHQVDERASPAIAFPYQNEIELALRRRVVNSRIASICIARVC